MTSLTQQPETVPEDVEMPDVVKPKSVSYKSFIANIMHDALPPTTSLSPGSVEKIHDEFLSKLNLLAEEAELHTKESRRKTITSRDVYVAARVVFKRDLMVDLKEKTNMAITRLYESPRGSGPVYKRAGLPLPTSRISDSIRSNTCRLQSNAIICATVAMHMYLSHLMVKLHTLIEEEDVETLTDEHVARVL